MPSEAKRELDQDPEHWALRIMPMADFARAFEFYTAWWEDERPIAKKGELPEHPMMEKVETFDFAWAHDLTPEEFAELEAQQGQEADG